MRRGHAAQPNRIMLSSQQTLSGAPSTFVVTPWRRPWARAAPWAIAAAALALLAALGVPASAAARVSDRTTALAPRGQTLLLCRTAECSVAARQLLHQISDSLGLTPVGVRLPSLQLSLGSWGLTWSSGLALNYSFVPRMSKAKITYKPDLRFRSYVIKLTAEINFF